MMTNLMNSHVTTVVRNIVQETPRISRFELSCPDFWELPAFTAGAHIDVVLPDGEIRQYSLCGDPADRYRYQIAVQREEEGRGGSLAMHKLITTGSILPVSVPRNLFALSPIAQKHIFIAGGIGITPFISMIAELEKRGGAYELHYCSRNRAEAAFLKNLEYRASQGDVFLYHDDGTKLDLKHLLREPLEGHHAYCCGPASLLDAFLDATQSWGLHCIHYERFGKDPLEIVTPPYEVQLARSNKVIQVEANQTLASALMANGAALKVACEAGVCGTCKVRFIAGSPVHRDLILSEEDRMEIMTPCVSSGESGCLVLDL